MFYNNQNTYNTFGNNAVSIGSQLDANVAARVKQQAEALQQNMYTDLQSTVKSFPEHNLDVNYALNNGQRNFDNFMQQNATREVLDFGNPNWYGRQDLIESLKTGNYTDISFGSLPENIRQQVNQIRINNAEIPLEPEMIIPAGVVKKWSGNRLVENYSPERITQIADEIFHSPDVNVYDGSYKHIQKLVKERPEHTNDFYGFISRDKTTGQTTAKTIYERGKSLAGRQPASLQNESSAGRMRLSDLQTPSNNKLSFDEVVVNRNLPHVSGLYEGLTPEQSRLLNEAFIKAKYYNPYGFTNILPDVNYALNNGQRNFDNFMQQNATREVLDFTPTKKDLVVMQPRSLFNPNRGISNVQAEDLIRNRLSNVNLEVFNDNLSGLGNPELGINHFLRKDKKPFIRTIQNTYESPDIKFINDGKEYYIRKYKNADTGNTFEDLFIIKDGKAFNKLPSNEDHILNKIKGAQDLSLAPMSRVMTATDATLNINNIPLQSVVVNRNLPHVSGLYEGLTPEQSRLLNEAFIKAKYYNPYGFTNILPDVNYALNNGQRTRILQNMSVDDVKNRLLQIKQERFRNITPQTGLTPEEYANIVQQQADNLGVKIAEGNPDKINSGVMHFVLDDNGKISYRAPFVGTLKDTYINPDITFSKGVDKNYVRAIRDIGRNKNYLDNLITRNGNFYTKYPTSITNIAKKIGDPHNDLSVSGDFLSDMGISPSGGSNNNIALQKGIVNGQPLDVDGKKLGTLGSLAAVQEALLQQATMSQNPQIKRDLLTAEKRLNKMLPAEYTQKRQSLDKAKSLKNSYELGLNFNPEYMDYDALNLTSARDKHAFLQGRVNRILLNSSNNPELLAMVQQDIETTRKIARKQLFENNMEYIRKNQFLQNQLDKLLAEIEQNKRRSVLFKQRKIRTADKYLNDNYGAITAAGLNNGLNNAASAGARQYLIEKIAE